LMTQLPFEVDQQLVGLQIGTVDPANLEGGYTFRGSLCGSSCDALRRWAGGAVVCCGPPISSCVHIECMIRKLLTNSKEHQRQLHKPITL
jgi:hypothetical protein